MKLPVAALIMGIPLLVGCQTKQISELSNSERQALAGKIAQRCIDAGHKKRTPAADACLRREAEREYAKREASAEDARLAGMALSQGFSNYGQTMSSQPLTLSPSSHRPIRCTSTSLGGSIDTTCY